MPYIYNLAKNHDSMTDFKKLNKEILLKIHKNGILENCEELEITKEQFKEFVDEIEYQTGDTVKANYEEKSITLTQKNTKIFFYKLLQNCKEIINKAEEKPILEFAEETGSVSWKDLYHLLNPELTDYYYLEGFFLYNIVQLLSEYIPKENKEETFYLKQVFKYSF